MLGKSVYSATFDPAIGVVRFPLTYEGDLSGRIPSRSWSFFWRQPGVRISGEIRTKQEGRENGKSPECEKAMDGAPNRVGVEGEPIRKE